MVAQKQDALRFKLADNVCLRQMESAGIIGTF